MFGPSGQPKYIDHGTIAYAAPHQMMIRVESTKQDGKATPIDDPRADHWIFDGKSIFEYNSFKKQVIEHKLPPDIQAGRLVDGPLAFSFAASIFGSLFSEKPPMPFPFGAKAAELKQRYFIRAITPKGCAGKMWLEAYPRGDIAVLCSKMQLIFTSRDMSPIAMRIVAPNGRDFTVFQFFDIVVNGPPSATDDDPFRPAVPPGWQRIGEESPSAQAHRRPSTDGRR